MAAVLATVDGDGRVSLTIPKNRSMQGDEFLVDLFQAAGLPSVLEDDMGRWLRSQAPLTLAMEAVAGAGMAHKHGATWGEAKVGAGRCALDTRSSASLSLLPGDVGEREVSSYRVEGGRYREGGELAVPEDPEGQTLISGAVLRAQQDELRAA